MDVDVWHVLQEWKGFVEDMEPGDGIKFENFRLFWKTHGYRLWHLLLEDEDERLRVGWYQELFSSVLGVFEEAENVVDRAGCVYMLYCLVGTQPWEGRVPCRVGRREWELLRSFCLSVRGVDGFVEVGQVLRRMYRKGMLQWSAYSGPVCLGGVGVGARSVLGGAPLVPLRVAICGGYSSKALLPALETRAVMAQREALDGEERKEEEARHRWSELTAAAHREVRLASAHVPSKARAPVEERGPPAWRRRGWRQWRDAAATMGAAQWDRAMESSRKAVEHITKDLGKKAFGAGFGAGGLQRNEIGFGLASLMANTSVTSVDRDTEESVTAAEHTAQNPSVRAAMIDQINKRNEAALWELEADHETHPHRQRAGDLIPASEDQSIRLHPIGSNVDKLPNTYQPAGLLSRSLSLTNPPPPPPPQKRTSSILPLLLPNGSKEWIHPLPPNAVLPTPENPYLETHTPPSPSPSPPPPPPKTSKKPSPRKKQPPPEPEIEDSSEWEEQVDDDDIPSQDQKGSSDSESEEEDDWEQALALLESGTKRPNISSSNPSSKRPRND